jgi:hypothetical protein
MQSAGVYPVADWFDRDVTGVFWPTDLAFLGARGYSTAFYVPG